MLGKKSRRPIHANSARTCTDVGGKMTASTGDLLALQCQGNAYAIAKGNERKRFNETAAMIRAAHNNGATQRQIATAVKWHRQTVARVIKGMDDKRRTAVVDLVETNEI